MSVLPVGFGGGGAGPAPSSYTIYNSLRFRGLVPGKLSRTNVAATNPKIQTHSFWVKRGLVSTAQVLAAGYAASVGANEESIQVNDAISWTSPGGTYGATSTAVLRDPTGHYHVVVRIDTTQATAADRVRIYVNNTLVASASPAPPLNYDSVFSVASSSMAIGGYNTIGGTVFTGYISDYHMIDGQSLAPSDFGAVDGVTGVWIPKAYAGTYGNNGFFLGFADGSNLTNLAADQSGNGNNFTTSGISLTAGRTYDWSKDTPSNNYPLLNPVNVQNHSIIDAGMAATLVSAVNPRFLKSTLFSYDGKYYFEYERVSGASIGSFGIADEGAVTDSGGVPTPNSIIYFGNGTVYKNGSVVATLASYTTGDTMAMAHDVPAGTVAIYKNNTLLTTITGMATTVPYSPGALANSPGDLFTMNFGQRPFVYTPPTGFAALCTGNMNPVTVKTSGTFAGNGSNNGPTIYLGGSPVALTINGNAVTWGTHADKLATGFKIKTSSGSYNTGSNSFTVTGVTDAISNPNRAKLNP